ncbi:Fc.00g107330.m01.CDS01 [Cosmosporella sp. VM-42]
MFVSCIWRRRLKVVVERILEFTWVVVIYLASELVIWGLSRTLAPANLQFFASILGMVLTFALMVGAYLLFQSCDDTYRRHIKSKVDFINTHLGLGFPIPLVMLNQSDILDGREISRLIANFVITNLVSWTTIFALSFLILAPTAKLRLLLVGGPEDGGPRPLAATPPRIELPWSDSTLTCVGSDRGKSIQCATPDPEAERSQATARRSSLGLTVESYSDVSAWWQYGTTNFPILASFLGIFVIGAPLAAVGEDRILDGCVLWFIWISSVRIQRLFKTMESWLSYTPKLKNTLATLMNPVLSTTLLMTAYTRVKAVANSATTLTQVLRVFSSGTPLYTLWTFAATGRPLPDGMRDWFGAGDAALSILECGILIWGFKLYECRHQLFSIAGLCTILISIAAAAANVFLSVLSGRTMGMGTAESLAFAARSTTLALAKPAMVAVGGNLGANAALVVSNGILGQLIYPFALDRLGVKEEGEKGQGLLSAPSQGDVSDRTLDVVHEPSIGRAIVPKTNFGREIIAGGDDPITIAAGITIGINGAAMGVAYLYETKSRAAPYAALAMTVFGIMTVLFTTVEPFKGVVIDLAS